MNAPPALSIRRWMHARRLVWVAGGAIVVLIALQVLLAKKRQPDPIQVAAPTADADGNVLANPRFEDMSGEAPAGWVLDPKLRPKGDLRVVTEDNERLLQLSPNRLNIDKDRPYGIGQLVAAGAFAGTRVRARASLRITPGATAFLLVFALGKDGTPLGNIAFTRLDATPDLRSYSDELTVDKNAASILFACTVTGTSGTASFGGLFLGVASAPGAGAPAPQLLGSLTASIHVDASKVLKEVPRGLFGTNVEWVRDGNGLWDAKHDALKPNLVQRARDLGTTIVRYPGGGYADYFDWHASVGPRATRQVRQHVLDPESSKLLFGTHEFIALCRAIGADPLITVNVVANNAADAAAWVAYSNQPSHADRTRNGSAAPFDVMLWEIGNEQYIKPQASNLPLPTDAYLPTTEYVKRFREYARTMKQADPRIRIGAPAGRNFGRMRLMADDTWESAVLREAGEQIDFLAIHNAYAPLVMGNDDASSFYDVYRALLAYPQLVAENFADINKDIETYAPQQAARITIAVTEWGPLFAYDMRNRWIDHSKTLGSGLFVASMVQTFLRADRVEMANFFKLTENGFMGWIGADGEPKPSYYAIQLYRQHFGTRLVQTSTDVPSYDVRAIGLVDSVQHVPYLDVVSSLSADGATLSLIAVNRNIDVPIDTEIDLAGFDAAVPGRAWMLTAPSLDANNGKDLPGLALLWAKQASAPRNPMFDSGRASTVVPQESTVANGMTNFHYRFAPRSVTAIELKRGR